MDTTVNDPTSPGSSDSALVTTLDPTKDLGFPNSSTALGHQGAKYTGDINDGLRVLYCTNLSSSLDYEQVYLLTKIHGDIQRIRLILDTNTDSFECYVVYKSSASALKAKDYFQGHSVNDRPLTTNLYNINNFEEEPFDFFPINENSVEVGQRKSAIPRWFVASYKAGKENLIKGAECIRRKIGSIPDKNLKRYGRSILIKAGNDTQSRLLENFKTSQDNIIASVVPHKSFNNSRGIVYSKELGEFMEEEILNMCPPNVLNIRKFKGTDNICNAIQLTFISPYLPDYIKVSGIEFQVKKFQPRPTQCRKCFEYGHVLKYCENVARCFICSGMHNLDLECNKNKFCFHCRGTHSPNWRQCPVYKLNQDILETAENEHISYGAARKKLRRVPNDPLRTFSSVVKYKSALDPNSQVVRLGSPPSTNLQSTVVCAEIHSPVPDLAPAPATKPLRNTKHTEKKKTSNISLDGFLSPPRNKKSRPSSPPKHETEISNRFDAIDPFGPLHTTRPLEKMTLSSSCTDLEMLDTCNPNSIKVNKSAFNMETTIKPDSNLTACTYLNKKKVDVKEKISSSSSTTCKDKDQGCKIKRLNYQFKSFNHCSKEAQSKGKLAGPKAK